MSTQRTAERTMDKIVAAFAEAVAVGAFQTAEGWLAVATFARDRVPDRGPIGTPGRSPGDDGPAR
ncbi:MAG: hypothetical protein ABI635_03485 [Actinomycetota bacterium]